MRKRLVIAVAVLSLLAVPTFAVGFDSGDRVTVTTAGHVVGRTADRRNVVQTDGGVLLLPDSAVAAIATPTPSPTATATATETPTASPTASATPDPTVTPSPASSCSTTVASTAAAASAVRSAADGATVCVAAGSYGALQLSGTRTGYATLQPVPGARVTFASVELTSSAAYYDVEGFTVTGQVAARANAARHLTWRDLTAGSMRVEAGVGDITIDHNQVANGITFSSTDCSTPGVPSSCTTTSPRITDVKVTGNRFTGSGDAAVRLANTYGVLIAGNEFTGIREDGSHTDGIQTVWGAGDVTIRRNWFHANRSQLMFFKDGRVSTALVDDNLVADNNLACVSTCSSGAPIPLTFYDTTNLTIVNNTTVNNEGGVLVYASGATVNHNVWQRFGGMSVPVSEDYDLLGQYAGSRWSTGPHTLISTARSWRDAASGDYRLSGPITAGGESFTPGVDWRPADFHYGPGA